MLIERAAPFDSGSDFLVVPSLYDPLTLENAEMFIQLGAQVLVPVRVGHKHRYRTTSLLF